MSTKLNAIVALLFAMTSVVAAAKSEEDVLYDLAIAFFVMCVIILIIAILIPIIIRHRHFGKDTGQQKSRFSSKYNLNYMESREITSPRDPNIGVYGHYVEPMPSSSIYLPLEKKDEQNGYAHLEGTKANGSAAEEDSHAYEQLNDGNTFSRGPTYDNPGAVLKDGEADDGSEHDYELADFQPSASADGAYDNPVEKDANSALP